MVRQRNTEHTKHHTSMKRLLLCLWTWMLLVSMGSGSLGCLEEERNALLKMKAAFNHPNGSSLPSWHNNDGDCCGWEGVECDNTTWRVTELHLNQTRYLTSPLVIDASFLLPLEELQVLDLSENYISDLNGTLHPKNLKVLDLSSNNLVNDALRDIATITSLEALVIRSCGLNSSKFLEGLCRLKNLEWLDISDNEFWNPLPSCFCNMTSLRGLDVRNNNFSGAIPSSLLYNLKSLEYIVLSGNAFEGSLSLASLANNSKLTLFHLVDNRNRLEVYTEEPAWFPSFQLERFALSNCVLNKNASRMIPSFLKEQHELYSVQFIQTGMTGKFPNWLLLNNINLARLELIGNNLSGAFNLPSDLNLESMRWFDVSVNVIEGELPSRIGSIFPMLGYLNLSNNLLQGRIPPSIGYMHLLTTLDLSYNGLSGEIPETLAEGSVSLSTLKLSANNLTGQMLPRYNNLRMLKFLYLDGNHFTGSISPGLLNSSMLKVLDVSHNSLSGTVPNWIGDSGILVGLMLSNNLLRGPLPLSLCNLTILERLDLSSNNLGPNMPSCATVASMKYLHLANDRLVGNFPGFLSGAASIITLDLRYNALSGEIPSWIGSLPNLKVLLLQGNHFEGSMPLSICLLKNMSLLDLSNNNLSGKIPSCLKNMTFGDNKMSTYSYFYSETWEENWGLRKYKVSFDFTYVYFEGEIVGNMDVLEEVYFMTKRRLESYKGNILKLMSGTDLSQNNLTGFIPPEVGYLSELHALNLSHNLLMGPIPETFSKLKNVESLDLSCNSLSGPIPPQLTELYSLSDFSVAHNNLSGKIPDQNQFGTFGEASYENNPLLCGTPLPSCDRPIPEPEAPPSFDQTREDHSWREAFLWSFAGSYVVAFLGMVLFLCINSYYRYKLFKLVRKLIPSFPM